MHIGLPDVELHRLARQDSAGVCPLVVAGWVGSVGGGGTGKRHRGQTVPLCMGRLPVRSHIFHNKFKKRQKISNTRTTAHTKATRKNTSKNSNSKHNSASPKAGFNRTHKTTSNWRPLVCNVLAGCDAVGSAPHAWAKVVYARPNPKGYCTSPV